MRNLVRVSLALAVVVALLALPSPAAAHYTGFPHRHVYGYGYAPGQPGMPSLNIDRPGVYLGGSLLGAVVINSANTDSSAADFIDHGGGFGLFLGVRIVPMFALEFGYTGTAHNTYTDYWGNVVDYLWLNAITLDGKLIFPNRSNVRPYIQAGVGYYALSQGENWTSGGGFQLGGGLDIWLNPWWSLGGRVLYHGVKFTEFKGNPIYSANKPFLSYATLEFNLQVHF